MIEALPLLAWPPRSTLTTLIFHRVLPQPDPLRSGDPDVARFDCLMRFIARNFDALPLVEAVERLRKGSLPRRACCITFDDGYADNLTLALPVLETYRLPATVFVATGYLDGGRMFNDSVIDALAACPLEYLDLQELGLGTHPVRNLQQKRAAVATILGYLKVSPPELRDTQVRRFLEIAQCGELPTDVMLTTGQLRELASRGIEIGGHTVAHTILTTLDDARASHEMAEGKARLESLLGTQVTSFAYPNGKPERDFSARHVALAREVGFERAVTTAPGVGSRESDPFLLPRFTPWSSNRFRAAAQMTRNAWQ